MISLESLQEAFAVNRDNYIAAGIFFTAISSVYFSARSYFQKSQQINAENKREKI